LLPAASVFIFPSTLARSSFVARFEAFVSTSLLIFSYITVVRFSAVSLPSLTEIRSYNLVIEIVIIKVLMVHKDSH
jgi:hypothetical protein